MTDRERALSPDATKDHLRYCSLRWPAQFLSNPVVRLLLLEDPCWDAVPMARRLLAVRRYWARLAQAVPLWFIMDRDGFGGGAMEDRFADCDEYGAAETILPYTAGGGSSYPVGWPVSPTDGSGLHALHTRTGFGRSTPDDQRLILAPNRRFTR